MQRISGVLIVLAAPVLLAADADDARKELKALQGKWKMVAGEARGMPFPKDGIPDFSFVAGADGKATGKTPQEEFRFTMTINPKKNPRPSTTCTKPAGRKGKSSTASTNWRGTSS